MANRYRGWSSADIEKLLILDREGGVVDEDLTEEFDRRCTEVLDEAFEEVCARYPNVIYARRRRKGAPGPTEE